MRNREFLFTRPAGFHLPAAILLLAALLLAIAAAPASAQYAHTTITDELGSDGTSGSTFSQLNSIAYQQANDRLYVQGGTSIHGFSHPGPGAFNPLGGLFPFPVAQAGVNYDQLAVDNSATATANNLYFAYDGTGVLGFSPSGAPLGPPWPVDTASETCGVTVDNTGMVWAGRYGFPGNLAQIDPSTGLTGTTINLAGGAEAVCKVYSDATNGDLYPASYGSNGVWQYTAASGYSSKKLITEIGGFNRVAVNGAKDIVYVGAPSTNGVISAFDTNTGALIETIQTFGEISDIVVDEADDTLYIASANPKSRVKEMPGAQVPKATSGEPVGNSSVSGSVDPDGAGPITECFFEFGLDTEYGSQQACVPATPYAGPQAVTANLAGLEGELTYHYRLVAGNANYGGRAFGEDKTISPHNVKGLKTDPATAIERTAATLNATFEGNGEATNYYFEWGTDTSYGTQSAAPPGPSVPGSAGIVPLTFNATGLTANTTYHYRVVGKNGFGVSKANDQTFTTAPAVQNVTTGPATDLDPDSATLNGAFDIDALGGDTKYHFEYGSSTAYGSSTPEVGAGSTPGHPAVSATVAIQKGVTYHYAIVVTNDLGTTVGNDQVFEAPQPPSIVSSTSSNVTATTADLIARINPHGENTEYRFEYGTSNSYGASAPVPEGAIPAGIAPVQVTASIAGLEVGAIYHFRVVAKNKWGETASNDQTFSFFTANCPNAHLRQQSGAAYLPDCRAYELVSPANAGAVQLFPGQGIGGGVVGEDFFPFPPPPNPGFASSPAHFAYWGGIGQVTGTDPPNILQDLYVSSRTAKGWETHYPGVAASETLFAGGTECNLSMDRCINYDLKDPLELNAFDKGSNAPYVYNSNEDSKAVGRFPTVVDTVAEGEDFIGDGKASADFSHFAFSSNNIAFTEKGLKAAPGSAYDNDTAADTVELISLIPGGGDIPQDGGGGDEFIRFPDVSRDGSHILMSTEGAKGSGTVHLYMRVDDALSYDVSEGHGVTFAGMTPDGTEVFFTSPEALTADDTDTGVDLFMWSESTKKVTRLSTGSGGTGDADACTASWVERCGVQMPNFTIDTESEIPGQIFTPDSWISDGGEIYFYSPELLDGGSNGTPGSRNLFAYRNGKAQFVASFEPEAAARRIQLAPDGSRVAFVTATQVTSYDNEGFREMYTFDPGEPAPEISCVSCVPTGAAPTSDTIAAANGLFMSDDGRTFFSTKDALVPFDSNGLRDVYEYVDGRPQLISSGTSAQDTWGGGLLIYPAMTVGLEGVSRDGTDVYFTTFDSLVPQDENGEFIKFYDARTGGGFPVEAPPPPCKAADECHLAGSVTPAAPQVGTNAHGKSGNIKAQKKNKKNKGKKKKKKGKGKKGAKQQKRQHDGRRGR